MHDGERFWNMRHNFNLSMRGQPNSEYSRIRHKSNKRVNRFAVHFQSKGALEGLIRLVVEEFAADGHRVGASEQIHSKNIKAVFRINVGTEVGGHVFPVKIDAGVVAFGV